MPTTCANISYSCTVNITVGMILYSTMNTLVFLKATCFFYPFGHFKASKIGNIFSMLTKLCFPCSSLFFIDYSRYNALIFLFLCLALNQILSQPPDGWRIFGNVYSMMTTFVFQLDLFHFCHRHCSCPSCHTLFLARATEGTSL